MEQLESIVEKLEAGEVGLEQTLSEYERGRALFVRCRDVLERAEQRVEELNRSPTKAPEPHTGL
jgi:exodeoxyribonuclease VII small subunit